jgi:hypothetical protein
MTFVVAFQFIGNKTISRFSQASTNVKFIQLNKNPENALKLRKGKYFG